MKYSSAIVKIRLKKADAFVYRGTMNYLIAYDYSAGRADRYTVLVLNNYDPVTIGRELDLTTIRNLIAEFESCAKRLPNWIGDCGDVLTCVKQVFEARLSNQKRKSA